MVDAAVADLAANADHEGSPDQRNVLIDLDDWSGDALLEGTLRREAFGELRPRLLPEGGCAVRAPGAGRHATVRIHLTQHGCGIPTLERREQRLDARQHSPCVSPFGAPRTDRRRRRRTLRGHEAWTNEDGSDSEESEHDGILCAFAEQMVAHRERRPTIQRALA